jgi:hypothetical protein
MASEIGIIEKGRSRMSLTVISLVPTSVCRSIEKFPQKTAFVFILSQGKSTVATGLIRLFEAVGRDASLFDIMYAIVIMMICGSKDGSFEARSRVLQNVRRKSEMNEIVRVVSDSKSIS